MQHSGEDVLDAPAPVAVSRRHLARGRVDRLGHQVPGPLHGGVAGHVEGIVAGMGARLEVAPAAPKPSRFATPRAPLSGP